MTTRGKQIRHEHAQTHTDYLKSACPLAFVIQRNCLARSFCVSQIFWTDQRWLTIKQEGLSHYVTPLKNGDATTWQHSRTQPSSAVKPICTGTHKHTRHCGIKTGKHFLLSFLLSASVKLKFWLFWCFSVTSLQEHHNTNIYPLIVCCNERHLVEQLVLSL